MSNIVTTEDKKITITNPPGPLDRTYIGNLKQIVKENLASRILILAVPGNL